MGPDAVDAKTTAQAYLELLAQRGIEYLFANAGTDFAPLIEGFAGLGVSGDKAPKPITVPHENAAVAMAHGYYLMTGIPQAVMVHVNVGTANALNGIINAARAHIPVLFTAGRTPITESGSPASRNIFIHWGQETFDQAAMVREYVKWDYELRRVDQLETVVDRALEIAMTPPRGPVYLTLPREVLAERVPPGDPHPDPRRDLGGRIYPDPQSLERAAKFIAEAKSPLIITSAAGASPAAVERLVKLAEDYAIPVVTFNQRNMCFPTNSPMHLGFTPAPLLDSRDVILVVESDVPWYPGSQQPPEDCKVIHVGIDPSYTNYPIRSFPCDLALRADPEVALHQLHEALRPYAKQGRRRLNGRFAELRSLHEQQRSGWQEALNRVRNDLPLDLLWVSHCLNEIKGEDAVVFNEFDLALSQASFTQPRTYFGTTPAGGLGWALGAALGAKLAVPDRLVVAAVGDGSYVFGNPTACHFVSEAYSLPTLTIIFNNSSWQSVRLSTLGMYPSGVAAEMGDFPLTKLEPSPCFEHVVRASEGYSERVEEPTEVPAALERAVRVVQEEGRQAVLNMICKYSD